MNRTAFVARSNAEKRLQTLVKENRMNDLGGDIAHHFALAGTVKTIYVNRRQHQGLVSGTLGIVVLNNRHHLVPSSVALQIRAMDSGVAVIIADQDGVSDDVPDDLIW